MITREDEDRLRAAIAVAARAREMGDAPFGSLLVGPDGRVLVEAHNTVHKDRDITAHPELKIAKWAARELESGVAAKSTLYTSCEPCRMCLGAIERSGIGRIVYALSNEQLARLKRSRGAKDIPRDGPALFVEARIPVEGYFP
jgi:tRNA(Arg) A34 adenosine deaminase TadA